MSSGNCPSLRDVPLLEDSEGQSENVNVTPLHTTVLEPPSPFTDIGPDINASIRYLVFFFKLMGGSNKTSNP